MIHKVKGVLMSVSGISNVSPCQTEGVQSDFKKIKGEFEQLGKDLQTGNLKQAQADYATLQKDLPQGQQSTNSQLGQDFSALSKALQSGSLAAAQQAFAAVQSDVKSAAQGHGHHHHHHADTQSAPTNLSQDFTELGNDLKNGDIAAAQKAFSTLQNDLQNYRENAKAASASNSTTATSSVSVSA
jgi:hypothetical protein